MHTRSKFSPTGETRLPALEQRGEKKQTTTQQKDSGRERAEEKREPKRLRRSARPSPPGAHVSRVRALAVSRPSVRGAVKNGATTSSPPVLHPHPAHHRAVSRPVAPGGNCAPWCGLRVCTLLALCRCSRLPCRLPVGGTLLPKTEEPLAAL